MATKAKVNPNTSTPTHTISLSDGAQTFGLRLDGDYKYIQQTPQTPSTLMINQQGSEFGDFDPSMSHIQQTEWYGGRASERFVEDQTRYYDAKNMWTTSTGLTHPSLQWRYVIGDYLVQNALQLAKNYAWRSVANNTYSVKFTNASTLSAKNVQMWIRKIGNPGTLTIEIRTNSANAPTSTVVTNATATATGSTITDEDVHYHTFVFSSAASLSASTDYHLLIYGASTDNIQNHWEVMTSNYSSTAPYSYTSADRSTWTATTYNLYYRMTAAPTDQKWKFFLLQGVLYGAKLGTAKLYKIETSTDSYGNKSYDDFKTTEITGHGLTYISDILVVNNFAYVAQGNSYVMRRFKPDETTQWEDDGTNKADLLTMHSTASDGAVVAIYRAAGTGSRNVYFAPIQSWGTNLTYGTTIKIGKGDPVSSIISYQGKLYVFKPDSIWTVDGSEIVTKFNSKVDDAYTAENGRAVIEHGQYLYFSLDKSLEQLYGSNITDVGPHHGAGLPSNRVGFVSAMENAFNQLFVAIDGGTGYSSIMLFDGVNYHEVWRAPEEGKAITTMFWYSNKNLAYPHLMFDYGGQICFIKYPDFGFNPTKDTGIYYVPVSDLITSTFDMNLTRLPKFFNEICVVSKNLYNSKSDFALSTNITAGSRIEVYYQADNDINGTNWVSAGMMFKSPYDCVTINKSNVYSIRLRFKLFVSDANKPPIINATVLEGFARTPIKYQWVMRIKTSSVQSTLTGAPDHKPEQLYNWLESKAKSAELCTVHATIKGLDGKKVMIEPPSIQYDYVDPILKSWGGVITVVFREA